MTGKKIAIEFFPPTAETEFCHDSDPEHARKFHAQDAKGAGLCLVDLPVVDDQGKQTPFPGFDE